MSTSHEQNDRLRTDSGKINSSDPLVSFLYELMRDHLPVGTVERLIRNNSGEVKFTNGWLAQIALDQARRLDH